MSQGSGSPVDDTRRGLTFTLLFVACWALVRPYQGIVHDARLYALQALGRLAPDSLGQDIFLALGSQDAFTVFSPLYGSFIAVLGIEDAARVLTLLGQAWWFSAAAALAIGVLGRTRGILSVAIMAALPGFYGAGGVFRYAEPFLTPRLFCEALVLTGLALLIRGHRKAAATAMLGGLVVHPLLGLAGMLVWAGAVLPAARRWTLPAAVIGGTLGAIACATLAPIYPLSVFDPDWASLIRLRSPFLSMADWDGESWRSVLAPLVTFWVLVRAWDPGAAQDVFRQIALVGALGLIVTLVGATLTGVVLITQGQAWRWTWIATACVGIAAVRSVPILWRAGPIQRSALALLALGWILADWPAVAFVALAAVTVVYGTRLPLSGARAVGLASTALFCAGVYVWLTTVVGGLDSEPALASSELARRDLRPLVANSLLVVPLLALFWAVTRHARYQPLVLATALLLAAASVLLAAKDWMRRDYETPDHAALAAWKKAIPNDAEVFWPDNPGASWFMLERRVYVSAEQTAGIMFSPDAAREMARRVEAVSLILPPIFAFNAAHQGRIWTITDATLAATCERSGADFVVARSALGLALAAPPMKITDPVGRGRSEAFLYRCADMRSRERAQ